MTNPRRYFICTKGGERSVAVVKADRVSMAFVVESMRAVYTEVREVTRTEWLIARREERAKEEA